MTETKPEDNVESIIANNAATPPEAPPTPGEPYDLDAAKALVEQANQHRKEACLQEINAVLEKHKAQLTASFVLTPPNRITPMIDVVLTE